MITFRYHLVTIAAVFVALAAGVALGAGVLDESGSAPEGDAGTTRDTALTRFEDGYAARTAGALVDGTLADRSVVLLTLPGARDEEVEGVRASLEDAGATVTGVTELTSRLLDPANRQFAESVAEESGSGVDAVTEAEAGYARVGAALSRTVLGEDGAELDEAARTIAAAFGEGDLVAGDERPDELASLAVVVTGPSSISGRAEVLTGLVRAIGSAGEGALVAGPSTSSQDGGAVDAVRRDDSGGEVSTVDVIDTAAGRAVAALALSRSADGQDGSWGTSRSADGALPD